MPTMQRIAGTRFRFTDAAPPPRDPDGNRVPPRPGEDDPEPQFDARRRVARLRGRDQQGSPWGVEIFGPTPEEGYRSLTGPSAPGEPGDRRVGDAALGDTCARDRHEGSVQISALAAWSRLLDRHYNGR